MFDFLRRLFGSSPSISQVTEFRRAANNAEPEQEAEVSIIRACREHFGLAPRACNPADRIALDPALNKAFVESNDDLLQILHDQDLLLARGQVVWGQLVQANQILFEPTNRMTCPANAIYSTDSFFDGRLALLTRMAHGLFAQKGFRRVDRELKEFVAAVTDEMARVLRREMPDSYTGGRSVCFATCFIQPTHLPFHYLNRPSFPIIINPEETPAMMLLPSRYWPPELISRWRD